MHASAFAGFAALALSITPFVLHTAPTPQEASGATTPETAEQAPLLPASHAGAWSGPNRLWIMDPNKPLRSEGTLTAEARSITYTWIYKGEAQTGTLELHGQPGALRGDLVDTWHAAEGIALHGYTEGGVLRLFGTYAVGDGVEWGWRVELDTRDPEAFTMRMFNVMPEIGVVPSVVLAGAR